MVLRRLWTVSLNFTKGREQLVKMSRNIFSRFFYFIFIFSVSEQTFLIHIYPIGNCGDKGFAVATFVRI